MSRKKSFSELRAISQPGSELSDAIEARLAAAARLELARAVHHLKATRKRRGQHAAAPKTTKTKVGHMYAMIGQDDLPAEMGSFSDGVTDDASFTPEIIGCNSDCSENVAGIPGYLFSRKNLSNPAVRRRLGAAIKALTPKVRRRVLQRLRSAVSMARVSGIRSATPSVGHYPSGWASVSGAQVGARLAVGRCPYASVAGAFTP